MTSLFGRGGGAWCVAVVLLMLSRPGWSAWTAHTLMGQTVSTSYQCTTSVAIGATGDAVAAWINEPDGLAYAAVQRGGVWGPSQPICAVSPLGAEEIIDVKVGMAGNGTAYALLLLSHFERNLAFQAVLSSALPVGRTSWTKPIDVSARKAGIANLFFGVSKAGNALALWTDTGVVQYASKLAGGAWQAPQPLPASCPGILDFDMYQSGDAAIVWKDTTGVTSTITTLAWTNGVWQAPVDAVTLQSPAAGICLAIDGQARSAVAWNSAGQIQLARETAPGVWGAPVTISDPVNQAMELDLDADKWGDLAVAWAEYDTYNARYLIRGQVRTIGGKVWPRAWLTTDLGDGFIAPPRVALNPGGTLAAVTFIDNGTFTAYAATYTPAVRWSARTWIGGGLLNNTVAVASGPLPNACAVWPVWLGADFAIGFRASSYLP